MRAYTTRRLQLYTGQIELISALLGMIFFYSNYIAVPEWKPWVSPPIDSATAPWTNILSVRTESLHFAIVVTIKLKVSFQQMTRIALYILCSF